MYDRVRSFAIFILLCTMSLVLFCACETEREKVDITTSMPSYTLVVGEEVPLDIRPSDRQYVVSSENTLIASVRDGILHGGSVGETRIEVRLGDNICTLPVRVYDKIVSRKTQGRGRYESIRSALAESSDGETIYIEKGDYGESLVVEHDVTITSDGEVSVHSMTVRDGLKVALENITFYTREYPLSDSGSLMAGSECYLTLDGCRFFVDKKGVVSEEREGGYAIYVYPNSTFVRITNTAIEGYKEGIKISSFGGTLHIDSNRFSAMNTAIIVDIRDSAIAPINKPATGSIRGNIYHDVEREIDLLYNGETYSGMLDIERHDRIEGDNKK